MPKEKWIAKLHEYGAFKIKKDENGKENWKPLHRGALMPLDDVAIISKYNSEIRGLYNYTDWQLMYAIWENSILSCVAVA